MNVFKVTNENPIPCEVIRMTGNQMKKESDYHKAQKLLKLLLDAGLVSQDEFDRIAKLNREKFSPLLASIMP